ncbi:MAG: hypothetical protein HFJ66_05765 [Eggerthellaceae bacterium]|nr:hypothetical protein [Eggerthellaceae bacterium]
MGRIKSLIASPKVNIALFALAVVLLAFAGIGGTRAALTYFSETHTTRLAVSQIGVTLMENGQDVSWRDYEGDDSWREATGTLLADMLPEGEEVRLGQAYPEQISVKNSGEIGQYVRVKIAKYWTNAEGAKQHTVSPSLIQLTLAQNSGWVLDEAASTEERSVFYYNRLLNPGETTGSITESIAISPMVATKVTETVTEETVGEDGKKYTTFTTAYDYNGLRFCLEAEVDAVQEHNAEAAILSAWGKNVTVTDGAVTLEGEVK